MKFKFCRERATFNFVCVLCPIAHFRSSLSAFALASCHMSRFSVCDFWRLGTHTHTQTPTAPIHLRPDSVDGGFGRRARPTNTHTATMKIKFYRPRCVYSACFAYFIGKQQPPYDSFSRSHSFARTHTRRAVSGAAMCQPIQFVILLVAQR